MHLLDDWRALAIGAALLWGFWGFFAKIAAVRLDWRTALLFVVSTHFTIILCATVRKANVTLSWSHAAAVAAGVCGGIGAILMYRALEQADAGVVIAVSAQYVLVTALLSWALLGEGLGLRKIAGLVLAILAIVLLTWEGSASRESDKRRALATEVGRPRDGSDAIPERTD